MNFLINSLAPSLPSGPNTLLLTLDWLPVRMRRRDTYFLYLPDASASITTCAFALLYINHCKTGRDFCQQDHLITHL